MRRYNPSGGCYVWDIPGRMITAARETAWPFFHLVGGSWWGYRGTVPGLHVAILTRALHDKARGRDVGTWCAGMTRLQIVAFYLQLTPVSWPSPRVFVFMMLLLCPCDP